MHGNGRESCSCITTKWKQPQTRLSAHLPHSPDMLYPSMISGLLFLALSSRPGFSVLRSWLLWGEHLSQAHMPTEINSDTPGRSELNSILTPPIFFLLPSWHPPIFFLLPPCLPLTSTEAILPPEPPAQANISKDYLGWKQFTMASAHFPGVYPSVPQPKAARDQSSARGSLNTQLPKGSSTLKELQAPTQVEPGLPPRLYFYFAKSHTSRDRQTDRWLAGQGW